MARRMYDLDNGTENIKVKEIVANKITAVTSAITTEYDDLVVNGSLTVKGRTPNISVFDALSTQLSLKTVLTFANYTTDGRPLMSSALFTGSVIYDTDLAKLILWNGNAWVNLDGTALS